MKYRRNKVKREHGIIKDAIDWLEELTRYPEVSDIIPGVIEVSRSPEKGIVYKYETKTGCKILLKSNGSIQEAFVVTKNPGWVKEWIEKRFPIYSPDKEKERSLKLNISATTRKTQSQSKVQPKNKKTEKQRNLKQESFSQWTTSEEMEPPSISDQINPSVRKALRNLQKQLKYPKK